MKAKFLIPLILKFLNIRGIIIYYTSVHCLILRFVLYSVEDFTELINSRKIRYVSPECIRYCSKIAFSNISFIFSLGRADEKYLLLDNGKTVFLFAVWHTIGGPSISSCNTVF